MGALYFAEVTGRRGIQAAWGEGGEGLRVCSGGGDCGGAAAEKQGK